MTAKASVARAPKPSGGALADRVRQLRFERGLTPAQTAMAAGLAASGDHAEAAAPARDGKVWVPIGAEAPDGPHVCRVSIPAELVEPHAHSHEGHQWLLVLAGRLRLVLGGADTVLERDEAAEFHPWVPHWASALDGPVELLVVFDPSGRGPRVTRAAEDRAGAAAVP